MNLFFFLLFSYASPQALPNKIYQLSYLNSRYYLDLYLGSKSTPIKLAIDTSINTSLINSIECINCQSNDGNKYDVASSTNSKLITSEASYKKLKHLYTGKAYQDSFAIKDTIKGEQLNGQLSFISTLNVSLTAEVVGAGHISLGYFSDFINMHQKKVFVLYFGDKTGTITVGDINKEEINTTQLVYYPMTINEKEKLWYLSSDRLRIERHGNLPKDYPGKHKVLIDSNTWQFHIPRAFFFENIATILPRQCQISKNGLFYCTCFSESQKDLFPTFNFTIAGNDLSMGPQQYMTFDSSNNYCVAHYMINYYTEYWIIGINLLNEHNTIFDYENKQIAFYDKVIVNTGQSPTTFIIVFVTVALGSSLLFFGGYYLYKKYHPILD